jgi:hypothetical protein
MNKAAHLNHDGLQKIVNFKAYLNKSFSYFVLSKFPIINSVKKETIETIYITDSYWI